MTPEPRFRRLILLAVLAAGALLNGAALRGPLALDDFAQRAMIEGVLTPARGPFNLYDFVSDANRPDLLARGALPWWSDPRLVIRFLRPLPSALVWLDHRLFGYGTFGPHLLSLAWWAAAVLAAHALYRTSVGARPALVASTVFALSPTLAIPLVWLANRDALITLTFGSLALTHYLRWRRSRRFASGITSAAAFAATMLTGEYGICVAGYVVAFEVCNRSEEMRRRLTGVLPALLPVALYAVAHSALKYGAVASGFYRNPLVDPAGYVRAMPRVAAGLLASAWFVTGDTGGWASAPGAGALVFSSGIILLVAMIWMVRRGLFGARPDGAGWLTAGSLIALLPLIATEPSMRILGVAALGVSGAVGVLIDAGASRIRQQRQFSTLAAVVAAAVFACLHLIGAPLETRRLSRQAVQDEIDSLARFSLVGQSDGANRTTLVLRANYPPTVLWTPFLLRSAAPKHWRVLSQTFERTVTIRTAPHSIEVSEDHGPLFALGPSDILRTNPFAAGDAVEIPGMRATVLRIDDGGRPTAVRYEFDRDLDGPDVAWISEGRAGFSNITPPPVGFGFRAGP